LEQQHWQLSLLNLVLLLLPHLEDLDLVNSQPHQRLLLDSALPQHQHRLNSSELLSYQLNLEEVDLVNSQQYLHLFQEAFPLGQAEEQTGAKDGSFVRSGLLVPLQGDLPFLKVQMCDS
jgi:hypothetical protein